MIRFSLVLCVVIFSCSAQAKYLKTPNKSCNDTGVEGYCINCNTQIYCSGGTTLAPSGNATGGITCGPNTVCIETATIAYCGTSTEVCVCPADETIAQIDDSYNNQYYLVCINGQLQSVESCGDQYHIGDGVCGELPTTTAPTTSIPASCSTNGEFTKVDCSHFYFCSANTPSDVFACQDGEIFSEEIEDCVAFKPFDCGDYPTVTGPVRDPLNCSIFYTCDQGTQLGSPNYCPAGQYFNTATKQCTAEDGTCTTETCTPCSNETTIIGYNCSSYYQCVLQADGNYTTIFKTCPPGFHFDYDQLFCSSGACPVLANKPRPLVGNIMHELIKHKSWESNMYARFRKISLDKRNGPETRRFNKE